MKVYELLSHPFSFQELTERTSLSSQEKGIIIAAGIVGLCLAIIGAPILFYAVSYYFKNRHLKQLRNSNDPTTLKTDVVSSKTLQVKNDVVSSKTPQVKDCDECKLSSMSPASLALKKVFTLPNLSKDAKIVFQDKFYVEINNKRYPISLNSIQTYLLKDFYTLKPREQIEACFEFQELLGQLELAWKAQKPSEFNDMIHVWKEELWGLMRKAIQEEEAKNTYLLTEELEQKRKLNVQSEHSSEYPSETFNVESGEKKTILKITPFSRLLRDDYHNPEAPIYKNIELLTHEPALKNALLIGVRGDGNCTLRAFTLGLIYNAALKGGKAEVTRILKQLDINDEEIQPFFENCSDSASNKNVAQMIFENFTKTEKKLDFLLINAIRQKIGSIYERKYKANDSSAKERLHLAIQDRFQTFDQSIITPANIQAWLASFKNPRDEELSHSYTFANEQDLCLICQELKYDLIYYSVSNVLATDIKRDKDGEPMIENSTTSPATTIEFTPPGTKEPIPIFEKDEVGKNTTTRATKTHINYVKQTKPRFNIQRYQEGIKANQTSTYAICLFNRGGAHSDLVIP